MMSSKRITLCVLIAFLISFFILLSFQNLSRSYIDLFYLQDQFYSKELDSKHPIFIIGSSEAAVLNNTHINKHLKMNGYNYDVYNLSLPSDQPSTRLQTIEKIIKLKPEFVFYGVGFRDFANQFTLIQQKLPKPDSPLLDPQNEFDKFLKNTNLHFEIVKSPKFVTEKVLDVLINDVSGNKKQPNELKTQPKAPFYHYTKEHEKIHQKINTTEPIGVIDQPDTNDEVIAMKEIIRKLKGSNIKVVIFTTPYAKVFFENLSENNKSTFELILKDLSSEYNVPMYQFHDKYVDLNIWNDYNHIAVAPEAVIFNDDVEKMILQEVD